MLRNAAEKRARHGAGHRQRQAPSHRLRRRAKELTRRWRHFCDWSCATRVRKSPQQLRPVFLYAASQVPRWVVASPSLLPCPRSRRTKMRHAEAVALYSRKRRPLRPASGFLYAASQVPRWVVASPSLQPMVAQNNDGPRCCLTALNSRKRRPLRPASGFLYAASQVPRWVAVSLSLQPCRGSRRTKMRHAEGVALYSRKRRRSAVASPTLGRRLTMRTRARRGRLRRCLHTCRGARVAVALGSSRRGGVLVLRALALGRGLGTAGALDAGGWWRGALPSRVVGHRARGLRSRGWLGRMAQVRCAAFFRARGAGAAS